MSAFDLVHLERFPTGQTTIRRPREIFYFSYDEEHELRPLSADSLTFYLPPEIRADQPPISLSAGFETFVQRDDTIEEHLDGLLDTLQAFEENKLQRVRGEAGDINDVRVKADVITWRGVMTKILTAPFDRYSEFQMNATLFQVSRLDHSSRDSWHVLTACEGYHMRCRTRDSVKRSANPIPQDLMQYWGYKFETLATLPRPATECTYEEIESRESLAVNNNPQFISVVETGIGRTSLILAGEVDAINGEKPDNPIIPIPWIELKTTQEIDQNDFREMEKFDRKLMNYWAQSFLLGVPTIAVGFRNRDGELQRINEIETQRIPGKVKNSTAVWNGNVCVHAAAAFLDFLKQTIVGDGVWRIRRDRNDGKIEVFRIAESGTGKIIKESFKAHRLSLGM
nr:decapping nuclease rai1 [Quercus suber]